MSGAKELFNTNNFLLAYDYNTKIMSKFNKMTKVVEHDFKIVLPGMDQQNTSFSTIFEAFPVDNKVIVINGNRTFFELDPVSEEIGIYMPIFYDNTNFINFYQQKGGDHYACLTSSDYGKLVNITRRKIIKSFLFKDIVTFIVEEKHYEN